MGESMCNSIIDTVESVKDFIMLESSKYKLNTKTTHKTNPHIKTFGLTPNRQSSNLSDLSKELFGIEWRLKGTNLTDEYYQKPYGYNQEGRNLNLSLRSKY